MKSCWKRSALNRPGTDIEALKPRKSDVLGFLTTVAVGFVVIAILVWIAGIGS